MPTTLLILSANPKDTDRLRLDQEVREIDEGLQRSQRRDDFIIHQKWAVRPADIHRALLDCRPHIVHFAGHGTGSDGIVLEDNSGRTQLVSETALSGLFELFPQIECVVLNACYTETQAKAISQHVGYVVGMNKTIEDDAVISFSIAFYDAVGAGEPYDFAYKIGCSSLRMYGVKEEFLPILIESSRSTEQQEMYLQAYREHLERMERERLNQEREVVHTIGNAVHSYAVQVITELLVRLVETEQASTPVAILDISGEWHGMVNGQEQKIEIRQKGTVVHLKGIAQGDTERDNYIFIGEGRIVHNTLVFSWKINDVKGINIMGLSNGADVLDGK